MRALAATREHTAVCAAICVRRDLATALPACYAGDHANVRQLRTQPARAAHVPRREGHRPPARARRLARRGKSPRAVHRPQPPRPATGARARRRAHDRGDGRDLRVPRGEAPAAGAHRLQRRGARRDAPLPHARLGALKITEHLYNGFRFAEGLELFKPRMRVLPEAADGLKATARDNLAWLDRLLADKTFIAGDRFTIADIILYCAVDFGSTVGQPLDPALTNVGTWLARVAARQSASASLHPQSAATGMRG